MMKWHYCLEIGCGYKAKQVGNLKQHKQGIHSNTPIPSLDETCEGDSISILSADQFNDFAPQYLPLTAPDSNANATPQSGSDEWSV